MLKSKMIGNNKIFFIIFKVKFSNSIKFCIKNLHSEFRPVFVEPKKLGVIDDIREAKRHYIKKDRDFWYKITKFDEKTGERVLGWTKNRKGDTSTKLYYSFTENDMVFYTEDEWKSRSGSKSIIEVVDSLLEGYLKSMNRNHPFFKVFCEEFYSRLDDIDGGEEEFTSKSFLLVHELTLKYGLVSL